jgi:Bacterial dipeptidyl-peptidase Sh3 domain
VNAELRPRPIASRMGFIRTNFRCMDAGSLACGRDLRAGLVPAAPSSEVPPRYAGAFRRSGHPLEDEEGWGWVQLARDGYVSFIAMAALAEGHMVPTHRVAINRTFVYQCPDIKLPARCTSPLGAAVCVRTIQGAFAQIGDNAFVSSPIICSPMTRTKKILPRWPSGFCACPISGAARRALASIARPRAGLARSGRDSGAT